MQLIDGKAVAQQIRNEVAQQVQQIMATGGKQPHLAVIIVGDDGGSQTYVANKVKACHEVGFKSTHIELDKSVSEAELLKRIQQLNNDNDVDGFIVQLPLPKHISEQKVLEAVAPHKDVDGFHPINVGRMVAGLPSYLPATPAGIIELLDRYNITTDGKNCVVLGRSNIVGTPVSLLLSRKAKRGNATVTVCHSRTPDVGYFTRQADIIVAALGVPEFLKADMVKQGAVVIDVGTTRVNDATAKSGWRLTGDVDFKNVAPLCSYITPVPGGVGPMTIALLLKNTLLAAKKEIYA